VFILKGLGSLCGWARLVRRARGFEWHGCHSCGRIYMWSGANWWKTTGGVQDGRAGEERRRISARTEESSRMRRTEKNVPSVPEFPCHSQNHSNFLRSSMLRVAFCFNFASDVLSLSFSRYLTAASIFRTTSLSGSAIFQLGSLRSQPAVC
jgi:hypothetical protein